MNGYLNKYSISTIIITIITIIIIIVLAFFLYYYSVIPIPSATVRSTPAVKNNNAISGEKPVVTAIVPTDVVIFSTPVVLPKSQKSGDCFASSIAEPFRKDAFRCMVANSIYDPCFSTNKRGLVFCPLNPLELNPILIKLTKVLPKPSVIPAQENWAWFLVLEDGTYCSPFTGTRPFFNQGQDIAYYSCNSNDKNKQILLLGDLIKDEVWKANEAILIQTGNVASGSWNISSTQQVDIKTVWQ